MSTPLSVVAARLNDGAGHFAAGRNEEALAAYERTFDPLPSGVTFVVPPKLRAMLDGRKLDVLVALKRWDDARALVASLAGAQEQLDDAQSCAFRLAEARVAAAGGSIDEVLQAYSEAMRIADERLKNRDKVLATEYELLACLQRREAWQVLLETARALVALGQGRGDNVLVMCASRWIPYAYRGLGEPERARDLAEEILAWARRMDVEVEIREWEEFLASLPK